MARKPDFAHHFSRVPADDVYLYRKRRGALGIGACSKDAVDNQDLKYVYHQDGQQSIQLSAIETRHAHLQAIADQPDVLPEEYFAVNKELKKLRHTIDVVIEMRKKHKEIEGLKSLVCETQDNKEMQQMASEELGQASEEET